MSMLARLEKQHLIILVLLLAVAPWLRGGREFTFIVYVFILALLGLFLVSRLSRVSQFKLSSLVYSYLGLTAFSALSLVWSVNRYQTFLWVLQLLIAAALFVSVQAVREKIWWSWWAKGYTLMASVASAYGFWLYMTEPYDRLTSLFYWANPYALYAIPAFFIAIYAYTKSVNRWWLAAAAVNLAAFGLTFSRSAALVFLIVAAGTLFFSKPGKDIWKKIGLAILGGILLASVVHLARIYVFEGPSIAISERYAEAVTGESQSGSDRLLYLSSAYEMWQERPLIGGGAGTFSTLMPQFQKRTVSFAANPHNLYIQVLAELGLIGAGLMFSLIVSLAWQIFRVIKREADLLPFALALMALVAHFGLDIGSSFPSLWFLAACLAGFVYFPVSQKVAPRYLAVTAAMLAVMVYPVLSYFYSELNARDAEVYQENGEYELAREVYAQSHWGLIYNPDNLTREGILFYSLGIAERDKRQQYFSSAIGRAEQATQQDPYDGQHYFLLARIHNFSKNFDLAEKQYLRALEMDPFNNPEYYADLAELYMKQSQPHKAIDLASRGIKNYPDEVLANRGFIKEFSAKVSGLYSTRGLAQLTLGNQAQALEDAVRAVGINEKNLQAQKIVESLHK